MIEKGVFVTFEGPNGVGKSSILEGVINKLLELGIIPHRTKEPSNSELGEFVLKGEEIYKGKTFAYLIAADRNCHIESEIQPALNMGKIVLSDRYIESSLVLQRMDGVDFDFIWNLNNHFPVPNLSIIITASTETIKSRLNQRKKLSRFERSDKSELEVKYYLEAERFLAQQGFNTMIINNENDYIDKNIDIIFEKIKELLIIKDDKK